jgi:hypothetical protein
MTTLPPSTESRISAIEYGRSLVQTCDISLMWAMPLGVAPHASHVRDGGNVSQSRALATCSVSDSSLGVSITAVVG